MPRIAGVATQKNTKGKITHLTIDVKKHKEIVAPLLEQLGVKMKSKFEDDWQRGVSLEEVRKNLHKRMKELWKK
ncbi:MAG: hypothetical protein ACKVOM_08210 [Ferruginibacter sp.]